jgi:hypothetical protein
MKNLQKFFDFCNAIFSITAEDGDDFQNEVGIVFILQGRHMFEMLVQYTLQVTCMHAR